VHDFGRESQLYASKQALSQSNKTAAKLPSVSNFAAAR